MVRKDDVLNFSVSLAFKILFKESGKSPGDTARAIGMPGYKLSKTLNFQRKLYFFEVHNFCKYIGVSISKFDALVDELYAHPELLQRAKEKTDIKKQPKRKRTRASRRDAADVATL